MGVGSRSVVGMLVGEVFGRRLLQCFTDEGIDWAPDGAGLISIISLLGLRVISYLSEELL